MQPLTELDKLRQLAGKNKIIPKQYEAPILTALSVYPELKNIKIEFKSVKKLPAPCVTAPEKTSIFKSPYNRKYIIHILEEAKEPEYSALFKNLPFEAQVGVIGHELVHVIQFHRCNAAQLIKLMLLYPFPKFKAALERGADIGAIRHGLGEKLHKHALYIRSIPGYVKKRPEINKYYLRPGEILIHLNALKMAGRKN